jgi:glycerate kinase
MTRSDGQWNCCCEILIAPDKFKGALSAREVAENIALGLRDVVRDAEIEILPMADGGEGTRMLFAMRSAVPG